MKEPEMELIAGFMADVLENISDENRIMQVKKSVIELTGTFPLYRGL
jgi:glycine/serine hydroxymethyltransferase